MTTTTDSPITPEQLHEGHGFLCRLSNPGYQARRALIARASDPNRHPGYLVDHDPSSSVRRACALDVATCGPKLDAPFNGAQILTDVYGEEDGGFDLTTVEPLHLDTTLRLGAACEKILPRREKLSMGGRRLRWFVKNANAGTLPLADQWKKQGKVIFFPDTSWRHDSGNEYVRYAYVNDGQWVVRYHWLGFDVGGRFCVLVSKEV
ncbi:MAG: hypothetical protein COU11_01135 [Candidatus Harrisonbacteria bacterium CG10_big_fil_rev_8_21_14_0_10_49_15]|uniref:Uncharacterized protein n=1 Tax=Candidatus Harrisonbacteria bacterium CG10_big_fil_rev_8_21_14_0_10_49_15 TaxID=1974587 RepID=A0A2H0UNJ8_9BACT|nr:MAG: hypothetical protein COU11_01135 [Candidatus Harrisonbacteria bacterium CG10_big_fil_rev_8_21_14_0_10_49_15]